MLLWCQCGQNGPPCPGSSGVLPTCISSVFPHSGLWPTGTVPGCPARQWWEAWPESAGSDPVPKQASCCRALGLCGPNAPGSARRARDQGLPGLPHLRRFGLLQECAGACNQLCAPLSAWLSETPKAALKGGQHGAALGPARFQRRRTMPPGPARRAESPERSVCSQMNGLASGCLPRPPPPCPGSPPSPGLPDALPSRCCGLCAPTRETQGAWSSGPPSQSGPWQPRIEPGQAL